ncbi:MAG: TonB-dependent siderophore receptor [Gammaproteobacteria bacterium]|nr:TonB-dependent siderophore receptor [Gammaproteobacteria bacterium]
MTESPISFKRSAGSAWVLALCAVSWSAIGGEPTPTGAAPPATSVTAEKKPKAPAGSKNPTPASSPGDAVPETKLDAVTVVAPSESSETIETAWGPVKGFVAKESSTATKTDTPLIETPASVSVITDDRMQGQKGQSIETLLNYTAGVRATAFGFGSVYSGYLIRGYQPSFFQLFRDSLVQYGQMQPEPYGLERIEVLRGPASVLYGEGSPGGLVNMVTKRPTDVPHYEVELNGGSWGFVQGLADLSGSLDSSGDWRYRFTTKNRNADTQMDFVPDNRVYMAPALTWQPSADTSITVLANFQKDTSNFAPYVPAQGSLFGNPNGKIPTSRYIGEPDFDNRTFTTYSLGYLFEHRFNEDLKIRQNVRYMSADIDYRFTFGFSPLFDNFTTVERESNSTYRQVGVFALDNQLQYKWDLGRVRQTILAGINYNEITDNFRGSYWLTEPLNVFRPVYGTPITDPIPFSDNRETVSQVGLYFQDQIKIDDHWIVMGGGRQDFVSTGFRDGIEGTASNQNPSAFTGRAGLMYLFDIGVAPYFSYSEAFSPVPGADRSNQPFQPERSFQYEVGVKYEPVDWKALFTLALFDLNRENALTVDPVNPNFEIQVGQTHTQGVELEGVMTLTDGLNLIANYTYLNPRNVNPDLEAGQGPIPQDVPKNMGSIWAQYEVQGGVLNGLGVGTGMHYTGTTANFDNTLAIPDYTIMDAMLYYQLDNWRFQVNANNVLDKTYVAWCGDETSCSYGQRRFILGSVRYTW